MSFVVNATAVCQLHGGGFLMARAWKYTALHLIPVLRITCTAGLTEGCARGTEPTAMAVKVPNVCIGGDLDNSDFVLAAGGSGRVEFSMGVDELHWVAQPRSDLTLSPKHIEFASAVLLSGRALPVAGGHWSEDPWQSGHRSV